MSTPVPAPLLATLICPDCRSRVDEAAGSARLACSGCGRTFPVTSDGVPVLFPLDSAFDPEVVALGKDTYYERRSGENQRKQRFRRRLPGLATDLQARDADTSVNRLVDDLAKARADAGEDPTIHGMVIGAGFRVADYRARYPTATLLVTDVEATFGAGLVGDVTALPLADATQDLVLCEHVLEHVVDPIAAAKEIERVLRPGGIALIKVPFNYPWHGGFIDFYRLTPAGYLAATEASEVAAVIHHAVTTDEPRLRYAVSWGGPECIAGRARMTDEEWVALGAIEDDAEYYDAFSERFGIDIRPGT